MVVDVLVAQQKAEQPLRNQLPHRMLDPPLAPVVAASRGVRSSGASAWRNSSAPPSVLSRPPSKSPTTLQQFPLRFEPFENIESEKFFRRLFGAIRGYLPSGGEIPPGDGGPDRIGRRECQACARRLVLC